MNNIQEIIPVPNKEYDLTVFNNVIVDEDRRYDMNSTDEDCYYEMLLSLDGTIDYLCKSPYCDRDRIMKSQYDIIINILTSYLSGKKSFILEAPTGVGKSIIGILVAETIRKYRGGNTQTYLLTSSKMLQDQMERDTKYFNLYWGILKGQNNYTCNVTGKPYNIDRECKDMSISKTIETFECVKKCGYINARIKAINAHGAVLSYAYWLTTMNFVYESAGEYAPFRQRHVTIFDECHMMSDIVQGMFQTEINEATVKQFTLIHDIMLQCNVDDASIQKSLDLIKEIKEIISKLLDQKISVGVMFEYLTTYYDILFKYTKLLTQACNANLPSDPKEWMIEQRRLDSMNERIQSYRMGIGYFIQENKADIGFIVKTYTTDKLDNTTMILRSLLEQKMIQTHVHAYCDFQLFMSATIGDATVYASNNGIEDYDMLYIESTFDYSKSPINTVTPPISMALKHKASNMGELMHRIMHICDKHSMERGLIHTGNFEISRNFREFIWENSNNPHRYIFYNDATQKQEGIKKLQKSQNGIIIGPSLTEGLDLKDDLCRFMIMAKVPYPALDEYNSLKMKLMPNWYQWKTLTTIIQSLGRGIRHKSDYCTTYLMDSCFELLFSKQRVPHFIKKRFGKFNIGNLQQNVLNREYEMSGLFDDLDNVTIVNTTSVEPKIEPKPIIEEFTKEPFDDLPF